MLQLFVELVEKNPLICNTLQFDQYSRLAFHLNIFKSSAKILKTSYLKFEKSFFLFYRTHWDEIIDIAKTLRI